jgi:hypothetical protein
MNSVLSNLLPETSNDKPHHLGDIVKKVLYGPQPNIALPSLKLPILHEESRGRFSEHVKPIDLGAGYMPLNF